MAGMVTQIVVEQKKYVSGTLCALACCVLLRLWGSCFVPACLQHGLNRAKVALLCLNNSSYPLCVLVQEADLLFPQHIAAG